MSKLKRILFYILSLFRKRKEKMDAPQRVLFCMCHWLGDTFWSSQVIPLFRKKYPQAEFFVLTKPFSKELFHGLVPDDHIFFSKGVVSDRRREKGSFPALYREAKFFRDEKKVDLILDFTSNAYSALFSFFTGAYSVGEDSPSNPGKSLYHHPLPCEENGSHPLYMRPRLLAGKFFREEPETLLLPPRPRLKKDFLLEKYGIRKEEKLALLVPGAGWQAKEWQEEKYAAIGKIFAEKGFHILISGSGKEREKCERIARDLPAGKYHILINALDEIIALLPGCEFVLCNDSGISHLAGAAGVKTWIFYCMTNSSHLAPPGENIHIFGSSCPLRPEKMEEKHHCPLFPETKCKKTCFMDVDAKTAAGKILQDLHL